MTRNLIVLALAACLAGGACADTPQESTPPMETALQQALEEALEAGQGVGVSAALIIPGRDAWLGASGVSRRDPDKPLHPRMVFQMASIKKNLIAALILQLADENRLSLDDPIGKWLPTYEHISPDITVRQLLNHTSGVCDYVDHPDSLSRRPPVILSAAKDLALAEHLGSLTPPPSRRESWEGRRARAQTAACGGVA